MRLLALKGLFALCVTGFWTVVIFGVSTCGPVCISGLAIGTVLSSAALAFGSGMNLLEALGNILLAPGYLAGPLLHLVWKE